MIKGNKLQTRLNNLGYATDGEDWDNCEAEEFKGLSGYSIKLKGNKTKKQ